MANEPSHFDDYDLPDWASKLSKGDKLRQAYEDHMTEMHQNDLQEYQGDSRSSESMTPYYVVGGILIPFLATFVFGGFGLIAAFLVSVAGLVTSVVKGVGPDPYEEITPDTLIGCKVAFVVCILIVIGVSVIVSI